MGATFCVHFMLSGWLRISIHIIPSHLNIPLCCTWIRLAIIGYYDEAQKKNAAWCPCGVRLLTMCCPTARLALRQAQGEANKLKVQRPSC
ncbi:protein of unknown function [Magnetospira sp. QH-2]|nr:protein of unknown function [Magnetospira sp. QH-2]